MRVAIYTLPKPPGALGGEDQMATFMVEELACMGIEADIYLPHEYQILKQHAASYCCLISNNIGSISPVQPSAFWHFNESFDKWHLLKEMGYTHVFTNSANVGIQGMLAARTKLPVKPLFLAAPKRFVEMAIDDPVYDKSIGYIGNFNEYKKSEIDHWMSPLAEAFGDRLRIWGGTAWKGTCFEPFYQGVLPTENWHRIPALAQHWVNFRSEAQASWCMLNDRIYWLLAAGARYVHTDPGGHSDLPVMVSESPEIMIERIEDPHRFVKACCQTRFMIEHSNLYWHRMLYIMHVMGARQVAYLGS